MSWARTSAEMGVSGAGLRTIVEPDASVGPSFSIVMNSGTFHGMIPAATPTGSLRTSGRAEEALARPPRSRTSFVRLQK